MNIALLLAGGSGSRLGTQVPKQYLEVDGKPVVAYCLDTIKTHPEIDGIWIVAREKWRELLRSLAGEKCLGFSEPGETRQLSVWNGLRDMKAFLAKSSEEINIEKNVAESCEGVKKYNGEEGCVVLIHDAARPLVTAQTLSACLSGCRKHDGVMPALPVKDTVYYGRDGKIEALLERSRVIAGQAPEAFLFDKYYEANRRLLPDKIKEINGSAEPAVLAGMDVEFIPGEERNFKITTQTDLERFVQIVTDADPTGKR